MGRASEARNADESENQGVGSNVRTARRVLRGGVGTELEVLEQEVLEQGRRC